MSSERSLADVDALAPSESAASGAARADESARPAPILTVRGLTKTFYGVSASPARARRAAAPTALAQPYSRETR